VYHLARFKALAELDYKVLGRVLEGAPDHNPPEPGEELPYPRKVWCKPHWFPKLETITWQDYKIWSWLAATKAIGSPISEEAETWHNYLNLEQTRIEAVEILGKFKQENHLGDLKPDIEFELYSTPPEATPIYTVKFDTPQGWIYRSLNCTLKDSRPIPHTELGVTFKKTYIKSYLEDRLQEYLALGGTKELIERDQLLLGRELPDPFYWDLWEDLDHLREGYHYWCADNHIDAEEEEEDQDKEETNSVVSWDTQ
jgi:hypothetical protein